ncbi:enoyl-CoA hydratase/isomerase family protein [Leucobacter sp. CSA1]|uniref:3-hydroxyisobutyryl-CoA hydrolase n=1 Tax=Leucobacter chromiisoli TaxID=2796471 RepID=A0A934Q626_9MICO|nr:enoyl-CoA hydratase/isomerase family protein [Leucobacter chromiisoli]MBK0419040.1 enoyl-CoA hydratase/isomerase family protein [Leucobacter chromiisoli]
MSGEVLTSLEGGFGRITLDRPVALNALTEPMIRSIAAALDEWEGRVRGVMLDSTHPKAFCAGGDIRAIRSNTLEGAFERSRSFFASEYRLNERIATYPSPFLSLIDGVCMGGGMGLSIHGGIRVVTENSLMAMPETAIGFFPDVGASYFLSRLPGALGAYWGLTGARISPGDAMHGGLGTHYVAELDAQELFDALVHGGEETVAEVVDRFTRPAPPSEVARHRGRIDEVFSAHSVAELFGRLEVDGSEWSEQVRATLRSMSPQSLEVTHALLRWARKESLQSCLRAELALAGQITRTDDFIEGVRAMLVDKDKNPQWGRARFRGLDHAGNALWEPGALVDELVSTHERRPSEPRVRGSKSRMRSE